MAVMSAREASRELVQGDDEVDFEYVAYVIDRTRAAGVDRVGLLPKELARR